MASPAVDDYTSAAAPTIRTTPRRFAHNPALDGFRGAAVLVVVLYHTELLTGGWIGVEMFFVLSGYLITSLLVIEIDTTGRVDLLAFWRRRARRLLPALFMLLLVVAVFVRVVADPTVYTSIRRDVWAALTYSSNWVSIYGGGGYWQHFAAPSPLRHMWSLAVEEQFYVVYPILAIVVLRPQIRRWALPALAIVALAWQVWMTYHAGLDRFYLGADTRAFGILLGACIALVGSMRVRRLAAWASLVAIAVLVVAIFRLDGTSVSSFHGRFQLVTLCTGTVVLGVSAMDGGLVSQALSMRWLTAVGRWSYGIYLIHWPIAEVLRQRYDLSRWPVTLIVLPVSVAVAAASFRFIESPLRRNGLRTFGRPLATATAALLFVTLGLGSTVVGARSALSAADIAAKQVPVVQVAPGENSVPAAPPSGIVGLVLRPTDRPYRVMLVGDSVGASLKEPLDALAPAVGLDVFSRAAPSCSYDQERTVGSPEFTEEQSCVDIVHSWAADVRDFRPDLVLFVYGSWSAWTYQDQYRTQCDAVMATHVQDLYAQAVADLGSTGAPVYFVAPAYWRASGHDAALDQGYDCLRSVMADFVQQHRSTTAFIDASSLVCSGADCDATSGGEPVRKDGLHYSGPGALTAAVDILDGAIEPPASGWPATTPIVCC